MTTVAAAPPFDAEPGSVPPENRAVDALIAIDPAQPVSDLDEIPEDIRGAAAYELARTIREQMGFLTLRERMVLAAALLPEFEMVNQP